MTYKMVYNGKSDTGGLLLRPKYLVSRLPDTKDYPKGSSIEVIAKSPEGTVTRLTIGVSADPDNIDSPFVLMPRKDPAAFSAMIVYAQQCEPKLREEIKRWLTKIALADPVYGTQGERNRAFVRSDMVEFYLPGGESK